MKRILVVSGPNINKLSIRDNDIYGDFSYQDFKKELKNKYKDLKFKFIQSNHEGKIIDYLQKYHKYDGLIINAGGLTHTSVSLRDCVELIVKPKISVHFSNILQREEFRKQDLLKDVVNQVFMGKKLESYYEAINYLLDIN